jgi:hypothetical protein
MFQVFLEDRASLIYKGPLMFQRRPSCEGHLVVMLPFSPTLPVLPSCSLLPTLV